MMLAIVDASALLRFAENAIPTWEKTNMMRARKSATLLSTSRSGPWRP